MAGLNLEAPTAGRDAAAGRRLAVWPVVLVAVLLAGLLAGNHLLATERIRGAARVQVDRSAADLADFARTWKPAKGASTSSVEGFLRAALGRGGPRVRDTLDGDLEDGTRMRDRDAVVR